MVYCGTDVEVVSMLVDHMRIDATVGRAMRLSLALAVYKINGEDGAGNINDTNNQSGDGRWRLP